MTWFQSMVLIHAHATQSMKDNAKGWSGACLSMQTPESAILGTDTTGEAALLKTRTDTDNFLVGRRSK
jgi:hypothetical protein